MCWVAGLCSGGGSGPDWEEEEGATPSWFSSRYLCQLISMWMAARPLHASSMGERRCCLNTSVSSSWFRLAVLVSESFRGPGGGFWTHGERVRTHRQQVCVCVCVCWVFSVRAEAEQVTNRSCRSSEGRKELNCERCSHSQNPPAATWFPQQHQWRYRELRSPAGTRWSVCVCVCVCVCVDTQLVPPASLWM